MAMNPALHYQRCQKLKESCYNLTLKPAWSSQDFDEARILIELCKDYGLDFSTYHPLESRISLTPPYPMKQTYSTKQ